MKNEFKPDKRKKFGQHFLNNELIAEEIVSFADIKKDETVLEIGPGKGILTSILLKRAHKVIAVEIDDALVKYLKKRFSKAQNLSLIHQDFLQFELPNLNGKIKVIGNLPYNIGVRIIKFVINHKDRFSKIIFMLQKEVAERLAAPPGIKEYGSLSIFTQLHYDLEILTHIPPDSFSPPPKVFSTLIKMIPKKGSVRQLDNPELFQKVVKAAFSQRRKKLKNNLRCFSIEQNALKAISQETGIDLDVRGEMLSIKEFISLTRSINKVTKQNH